MEKRRNTIKAYVESRLEQGDLATMFWKDVQAAFPHKWPSRGAILSIERAWKVRTGKGNDDDRKKKQVDEIERLTRQLDAQMAWSKRQAAEIVKLREENEQLRATIRAVERAF